MDVSATFLDKWLLQPFGLPSSGAETAGGGGGPVTVSAGLQPNAATDAPPNVSRNLASSWGEVELGVPLGGPQHHAGGNAYAGGDWREGGAVEGPTPQLASVTRWMEQGVTGASSVLARVTMSQPATTPAGGAQASYSASPASSARRVSFAAGSNGHMSRTRTAPVISAEPDGSRYASKALVADTYSYAAPEERASRGVLRTADPHYASIGSAYGAYGSDSMLRAGSPQRLTESLPGVSRVYSHGRVTPDDDFYYHGSRTLGQHYRHGL